MMDRAQLLADLNGYLRAYAEWNMPASNLTHTFSLSKRDDVAELKESAVRHFYADFGELTAFAAHSDWKAVVIKTARHWMTEGWRVGQLADKSVATEHGRHTFEETLVTRIESVVEPTEIVTVTCECSSEKKYRWYAACWDDLWLTNLRGEAFLLHFGVTD